jgi:hypothetical protein
LARWLRALWWRLVSVVPGDARLKSWKRTVRLATVVLDDPVVVVRVLDWWLWWSP